MSRDAADVGSTDVAVPLGIAVCCLGLGYVFWSTGDRTGVDVGYVALACVGALIAVVFALRSARIRAAARLEVALDELATQIYAASRTADAVRRNFDNGGEDVRGSTRLRATEALEHLTSAVDMWERMPSRPRRAYVVSVTNRVAATSAKLEKVNDRVLAETVIARRDHS